MDICKVIPGLAGCTRLKLTHGLPAVTKADLVVATDTAGCSYVCLLLPYTMLASVLRMVEENTEWMAWLYAMPCIISVCGYASGRGINDKDMICLINWICKIRLKLQSFWATGNRLQSLDPFKILYHNKIFKSSSHLHLSEGMLTPSNVLNFLVWLTTLNRNFGIIRLTNNPGVAFILSSNILQLPTITVSDSRPLDNTKLVNFVYIDQKKVQVTDTSYQQANLFITASTKNAFAAYEAPDHSVTLGDFCVTQRHAQSVSKKMKKLKILQKAPMSPLDG